MDKQRLVSAFLGGKTGLISCGSIIIKSKLNNIKIVNINGNDKKNHNVTVLLI